MARWHYPVAAMAAAVALTLASLVAVPAGTAAAPVGWVPTPGAKFNVPRSTQAKELILENQVIGAINHAAPGSTIEMVMFSFDRKPVSNALIAAHRKRHVNVQVITNGHELPGAQIDMRRAFGTNRNNPTFFYQCRASCRGQGDVQHTKFILFSHTGAARHVVMLGSLNMKLNGSLNQFNDLLTIDGNSKMYSALDQVYQQMKLDRLANPSYLQEQIDKEFYIYVLPFPRPPYSTKKTEYTTARDPIVQILSNVHCLGAATPSGRTVVRVNMHAWADPRGVMLAHQFMGLWKAGCDVRLQIGFAGGAVRKILQQKTARGFMPVRSTGFDTDDDGVIDLYSHEKMLLINGHYGATPNQKVVVTGSSNYQNGGQYGDELIVRAFSASLYSQYIANWNWMWANHTHGLRSSATPPPAQG